MVQVKRRGKWSVRLSDAAFKLRMRVFKGEMAKIVKNILQEARRNFNQNSDGFNRSWTVLKVLATLLIEEIQAKIQQWFFFPPF